MQMQRDMISGELRKSERRRTWECREAQPPPPRPTLAQAASPPSSPPIVALAPAPYFGYHH
ncbi:hypothetical protein CDL15_Pgr025936 [Punica granatum]|uniref:Uncharacterized protein n=1 Tax=Punica granatum TaxID=22663 RepID=A0A218WBR9_PUNGR|nr:hypothetical protein CDL15_Pgr025936 [Punica granatum]